jgi:ATP-binding protein involved in chromosome partitioning
MPPTFSERIEDALSKVVNTRTGSDVLSASQVLDIATSTEGRVRLTLILATDDDATLARDVRQAIERVEGVTDVRVDVKDATELRGPSAPAGAAPKRAPLPLPRASRRRHRSRTRTSAR